MAATLDKFLSLLLVGLVGWEEKGGRVEEHVRFTVYPSPLD